MCLRVSQLFPWHLHFLILQIKVLGKRSDFLNSFTFPCVILIKIHRYSILKGMNELPYRMKEGLDSGTLLPFCPLCQLPERVPLQEIAWKQETNSPDIIKKERIRMHIEASPGPNTVLSPGNHKTCDGIKCFWDTMCHHTNHSPKTEITSDQPVMSLVCYKK